MAIATHPSAFAAAVSDAIRREHLTIFKELLALRPERRGEVTAHEARTSLHLAKSRNIRFLRGLLVDAAFRPAHPAEELRLAVRAGLADVVCSLLDAGVSPDGGFAPLLRDAAAAGHDSVLRVLMADARVQPSEMHDLILWAADGGHRSTAALLLADGRPDPTADGNIAVRLAVPRGSPKLVTLLLDDARVGATNAGDVVVWLAVRHEWPVDWVRALMAHARVNPGGDEDAALCHAANLDVAPEVVDVLLADPRVDPSARRNAPLRAAAQRGNARLVAALLKHPRLRPDADGGGFALGYADAAVLPALRADPRTFTVAG